MRSDQDRDNRQEMKDEGNEDAFARGNRVSDGRELGTIILEIEIHQEVT